jgi:hypothetical protein
MSFRFQRRLKLFPGVRLNFSRGGISTTIGVRGASFTLGHRGTYVNFGIPGTGLSFRERIPHQSKKPSEGWSRPSRGPADQSQPEIPPSLQPPEFYQETSPAGAIRSGPVSTLTSAGLDELKKLINDAALKRIELNATVSVNEKALEYEQRRLNHARWFIVRLFTRRAIPRLVEKVNAAEIAFADARQQLAGCSIEIDFAFDQSTSNAFAALARSFDALAKCQKIWDITASVLANRYVERTIARHNLTRTFVALSVSRSDIIDTNYSALRLTNANGNDLYVYPGFVMMPSPSKDFALIDVRELKAKFSQSNFIEEEGVPSDSEVIGQTWKKTNKDGSRDRRFANNYQIPIARYAEIEFRSSSGLYEVYQFSGYTAAFAFYQSLIEYQSTVAALAERSKDPSAMPLLSPPQDDSEDAEVASDLAPEAPALSRPGPMRFLLLDWVALTVLVSALAGVGIYLTRHGAEIQAAFQSLFPPQIEGPPVAPTTSPVGPVAPAAPPVAPTAPPTVSAPVSRAGNPQSRRDVVYVLKPSVNVRSEPSVTSEVLTTVKIGSRLTVFQRQAEWAQVGEQAPIGWIHQSLLGPAPP